MDWLKRKEEGLTLLRRYRWVLAVLLAGLVLMNLPKTEQPPVQTQVAPTQETTLAQELEELLSRTEGAGKVKVLLTQAQGPELVYQTDGEQEKTVVITNADRSESGLVSRELGPRYLGAVVLCQGADRASVRLALVQAVMSATGLGADRITVLKMK